MRAVSLFGSCRDRSFSRNVEIVRYYDVGLNLQYYNIIFVWYNVFVIYLRCVADFLFIQYFAVKRMHQGSTFSRILTFFRR